MPLHAQLFKASDAMGRRPVVLYLHGDPQRQMLLGWIPLDYYHHAYALKADSRTERNRRFSPILPPMVGP